MASGVGSPGKRVGVSGLDVCGVHFVPCGSVCAHQRAMAMPPHQLVSTRSAPGLAWLSVLNVITLKRDLPCHSPINEDRKPEKTQAIPSRSAASSK